MPLGSVLSDLRRDKNEIYIGTKKFYSRKHSHYACIFLLILHSLLKSGEGVKTDLSFLRVIQKKKKKEKGRIEDREIFFRYI